MALGIDMTDLPAVIQADFVDTRRVKGRKVLQVILECPLEHEQNIMNTLGWPNPETSLPVAIARLQPQPTQPEASAAQTNVEPITKGKPFKSLPRSQQAGIRLKDTEFQLWLGVGLSWANTVVGVEDADNILKKKLAIVSKKELDGDPIKAAAWDALETDYQLRGYPQK